MNIREGQSSFKGHPFKFACVEEPDASWYTFVDEQHIRDRWWDIQPGDVVYDIGCGFGSYAFSALAAGAAYAHLWSPLDLERDLIRLSIELNGWGNRATFHHCGLYSVEGKLNADTQEFSPLLNGFVPGFFEVRTFDGPHPVTPLDTLTGRAWMKIDVEGAELEVLKGAERFIGVNRPRILVENHDFKIRGVGAAVRDFLEQRGYEHRGTEPFHVVTHSLYYPRAL